MWNAQMVVAHNVQATNVVPLAAQPARLPTQDFSAAQHQRSSLATVLVLLRLHQALARHQALAHPRGPQHLRHLLTARSEQLCYALVPPAASVQVRSVVETGVPVLLHQIAFAAANIQRRWTALGACTSSRRSSGRLRDSVEVLQYSK